MTTVQIQKTATISTFLVMLPLATRWLCCF